MHTLSSHMNNKPHYSCREEILVYQKKKKEILVIKWGRHVIIVYVCNIYFFFFFYPKKPKTLESLGRFNRASKAGERNSNQYIKDRVYRKFFQSNNYMSIQMIITI